MQNVPSGKWDHSGFEEMYGNGSGDRSFPLRTSARGGQFNRIDLARKVRLHITNLAPTVNSADLSVCFDVSGVDGSEQYYGLMLRLLCGGWFEVGVMM